MSFIVKFLIISVPLVVIIIIGSILGIQVFEHINSNEPRAMAMLNSPGSTYSTGNIIGNITTHQPPVYLPDNNISHSSVTKAQKSNYKKVNLPYNCHISSEYPENIPSLYSITVMETFISHLHRCFELIRSQKTNKDNRMILLDDLESNFKDLKHEFEPYTSTAYKTAFDKGENLTVFTGLTNFYKVLYDEYKHKYEEEHERSRIPHYNQDEIAQLKMVCDYLKDIASRLRHVPSSMKNFKIDKVNKTLEHYVTPDGQASLLKYKDYIPCSVPMEDMEPYCRIVSDVDLVLVVAKKLNDVVDHMIKNGITDKDFAKLFMKCVPVIRSMLQAYINDAYYRFRTYCFFPATSTEEYDSVEE